MEVCRNPWDRECKESDIEVYIELKGEKLPICRKCWDRLANEDMEW